ncbi:MAG: nitrogenase molybdenum-iron protein [Sarcina sp.]|nr:nitrogenase molybdenum-iron protein [Sarcina sp.]
MSGKLQDDSREKPSVKQQADPVQAVHSLQTPPPRGFRRFTTPFAPDQSGAVSVLYDMGGLCVVCDAGGCTGNICGFDEPRWFRSKSAVFSAGLRDMDAILGRDDLLVKKLAEAAGQIPADFAAIIGTPVPAVIGTDYRALCRMAEKKTGLPVLGIATNGMDYYDRGIEKTSLALLDSFCRRSGKHAKLHPADEDRKLKTGSAAEKKERIIGIWGYSPLDFAGILTGDSLRAWSRAQGYDTMICCGAGTDISLLRRIPEAEKNIVLSPAGTAPAQWLAKEYGIPWEYGVPDTKGLLSSLPGGKQLLSEAGERKEYSRGRKILVVHQQVLARRLADLLQKNGFQADAASFFLMHKDLLQPADMQLREETDLRKLVEERKYDIVIADRAMGQILAGLPVRLVHLPHFAVSGKAD